MQHEYNLRQVVLSFKQSSTNKFYRFKGSNRYTPDEFAELVNLIMDVNYEIRAQGRYLWLFKYNDYYYIYHNEITDFYPVDRWDRPLFTLESYDTYHVFPLFSDLAYNKYIAKIDHVKTEIETKLKEQGFVFGIKHKLVTEDFQQLIDSFLLKGYLKYQNRNGSNLILYDGKRYNIETLKKFFGFRNKHVHTEDIIVVNSRLKAMEQTSIKTSGQACKTIQCQPAQMLLKDIINRNNIPENYESLRKILVQLERYAHKKAFIIIPRIMVAIVLYLGTEYSKAKIHTFTHSGSSIRAWLSKLFLPKWFPEAENLNRKQPKIQKEIILTILNRVEPIKKEV